jgi:hypothetical protein
MIPYVSIDIETTGLDPNTCQVLEVGAVIDDWESPIDELPTYHCYVVHEPIVGSAYALSMHPTILRRIAAREDGYRYLPAGDVGLDFCRWLCDHGQDPAKRRVSPAGKNFASFDRRFLRRLPDWDQLVPMQHRSIDPGNLYWDPDQDRGLPNTKTCMERAGIPGEVAHTAVADALVVVKLVRIWHRRRRPYCEFVPFNLVENT